MEPSRPKLFGTDLQLDETCRGLDLRPDDAGDLALVAGNDNIIQALLLRLKVRQGELAPLGWPAYGSRLHELIGEPNIARTHVKVMAFAREAIAQDLRVKEVIDVRVQPKPGARDTVFLRIEIALIDQPTPLNLVFELNLEAP
jgi:phage baseplate assembly protein W